MRWGLAGARADSSGLAVQTKCIYDQLHPDKTMVVDISSYNKRLNQQGYDNYPEKYKYGEVIHSVNFPSEKLIDSFLDGLDIIFTVESPYSYYLYTAARERGITIINQPNYEFIDYFVYPDWPKPDILLAPSMWNYDKLLDKKGGYFDTSIWGTKLKYLPVPVDRIVLPYSQRNQAKTFLHIAGHETYEDRNGTKTVLRAIPFVKSDVQFIIRSQHFIDYGTSDYRVHIENRNVPNYFENFLGEDVLLLPRKYGGLSLQLAEAMSTGMIPLMLDISPQRDFLMKETLIPAYHEKTVAPRTPIDVYTCTPEQLAEKIDWLANQPSQEIKKMSEFSNEYADSIGWDTLLPSYTELLEKAIL
jgi:glycosyltransferase involved in cell wall biosynthesis